VAAKQAKLTRGYRLPALYVIHTVGPVYNGSSEDAKLLASCYRESLRVAKVRGIKSVSFPAISTGIFGYPIEEAAKIALKTVLDVLRSTPSIQLVRLVLGDSDTMSVHEKALKSLMQDPSIHLSISCSRLHSLDGLPQIDAQQGFIANSRGKPINHVL
jgi:O-acetyl-ADP-ribose deacetylase (regulator of RNase III)